MSGGGIIIVLVTYHNMAVIKYSNFHSPTAARPGKECWWGELIVWPPDEFHTSEWPCIAQAAFIYTSKQACFTILQDKPPEKSQYGFPNVCIKITVKSKAMFSNFFALLNIESDISCPYKDKGYKNRCTFSRIIS